MRVAVALLLVLAACAIFVIQAEHCAANTTGNQTGNQTGNHTTNQTNQTNQTHQNNNNSANSTDDEDQYDDYNDEYNNYYDNSSDEDYYDTDYYEDTQDNDGGQYSSGAGAITGVILSSAGSHAVPNANVALYDEYDNLADVPDNPQLSSDGIGNNGGVYTFYDVPYGLYKVTAEKGGIEFFAMVNLSSGTATANVVLPEYVETEPAYQEPLPPEVPAPTPRPFRYYLPITVGKLPASVPANENLPYGLAALGSICALYLFTRRNGGT